jgi:hypothetical protein
MCPTPTGRIHTRTATIFLPALLGLIISLITGHWDWLIIVGIYYVMGIFLDTAIYSWLFRFQPPWMTFVLGVAELGLLLVLAMGIAQTNDGGLENVQVGEAIIFYIACWILAIPITKVVLLPLISLTYLESAGEIRRIEWSIPESQVPVPVGVSPEDEAKAGPGPLVREASGAHAAIPRRLPSPSAVHEAPQGGPA